MPLRLLLALLLVPSLLVLTACDGDDDDSAPTDDDDAVGDDDDVADDDDSAPDDDDSAGDDDDSAGDDDDATPPEPQWASPDTPWAAIVGAPGTFGHDAALIPDLDADGLPELAVLDFSGNGTVFVFLAAQLDGSALLAEDAHYTFAGASNLTLGEFFAPAGDVTGDGTPDLAVAGSPFDANTYIVSGADIATGGAGTSDAAAATITGLAPSALAGPGDVTGDGADDLVIGSRLNSQAGTVAGKTVLISGAAIATGSADAGAPWASWLGEGANQESGAEVGGGDVDGDGVPDVFIAAPGNSANGANAGKVYGFSGQALRDGSAGALAITSATWTLLGAAADDQLGTRISLWGDRDADGTDDLALVSPRADHASMNAGAGYLFPTAAWANAGAVDLSVAAILAGNEAWGPTLRVGPSGDVDGDGAADPIVGFPGHDAALLFFGAELPAAASVADGDAAAATLAGGADSELGGFAGSPGDLDGDGLDDLVLVAPGSGRVVVLLSPYGETE